MHTGFDLNERLVGLKTILRGYLELVVTWNDARQTEMTNRVSIRLTAIDSVPVRCSQQHAYVWNRGPIRVDNAAAHTHLGQQAMAGKQTNCAHQPAQPATEYTPHGS